MYSEIGAVKQMKQMTIAQYDNNINLFFDSVKSVKLQINGKDPMAHMDQAFVRNIFVQLKKSEFTSLERRWQMDKDIVTSQSLMDGVSTYYAVGNPKSTSILRSLL